MHNIISDISTLTTIPESALNRLTSKAEWCICDALARDQLEHNDVTGIDMGIGTLFICVEADTVKYKFVPIKHLEQAIITTVKSGKSPLTTRLEKTLINKILNTYKDFV